MRKRIKLKRKYKIKKIEKLILIYILILIFIIVLLIYLGNIINNKMMNYTEIEVSKLSKLIVNNAVNDSINEEFNNDLLFDIQKNEEGNIQTINFNTYYVNKILSSITNNIINIFDKIEKGNSTVQDFTNNLITNSYIKTKKEGVIMEIPIGVITNNSLLSNLGPKIPIRISLSGELESRISTKIENYGINNALINVYVNIKVSEQIILPISSKKITISNDIPISLKMIQGIVPNYYFNGINSNSNLLTVPLP